MTTLDLDALERAARAATPGPWLTIPEGDRFDDDVLPISSGPRWENDYVYVATVAVGFDDDFEREQQANAEYIIAANPAAILSLISDYRALQERVEEAEKALRQAESIISYPVDRRIDPDGFALRPNKDIRYGVEIIRAARTKAGEPHEQE